MTTQHELKALSDDPCSLTCVVILPPMTSITKHMKLSSADGPIEMSNVQSSIIWFNVGCYIKQVDPEILAKIMGIEYLPGVLIHEMLSPIETEETFEGLTMIQLTLQLKEQIKMPAYLTLEYRQR